VFSGVFTRLARPGVVMIVGSVGWGAALALFGVALIRGSGWASCAGRGADTVSVVSASTIVQ